MDTKLVVFVAICFFGSAHARKLQISLTGLDFPYEDIFEGYPDAYVVVHYAENPDDTFENVGETEVKEDATDPIWAKTFDFDYIEENSQQRLKFEVFDEDIGEDDLVGNVGCTLKELVDHVSMTLVLGLQPPGNGWVVAKGKFID